MRGDELVTRRDYIASWMTRQGLSGRVGKHIVLRAWCEIVDTDRTYQVSAPVLPDQAVGLDIFVMATADDPTLSHARVLEDRGPDGLFVKLGNGIEFLVARDDVKTLPIPFRPLAIPRSQLRLYIGDEAAAAWHERRRANQRSAQE